MSQTSASFLMISVLLVRSLSFLFSKFCLEEMNPYHLLGVRFFLAFLVLWPLFGRHLKKHLSWQMLKDSAILGGLIFAVMACEMMALMHTEIYIIAFLENSAFIFVALFTFLLTREVPSLHKLTGIAIVLVGVGCLTLAGNQISFNVGTLYAAAASFFYGIFIMATARMAEREDPLALGVWQMGWMGLFSLAASYLTGGFSFDFSETIWYYLAIQILVCTAFGFTFQTVAQKYISADDASFLCALDPIFAMVWGCLFAEEEPGLAGLTGSGLIILGILYIHGKLSAAWKWLRGIGGSN